MSFNSFVFAAFLPIVFICYWIVGAKRFSLQNVILVIASYVFYGWWDWRFLSLLALSTVADYAIALFLDRTEHALWRKVLLIASCSVNLGLLGFFKYFNFFVESWVAAWGSVGVHMDISAVRIILPVGISFYTFQTLSYTIDVYRKDFSATRNFVAFAAYVSFFPQLVAGPIERATHLLPQFAARRFFSYDEAVLGGKLILWGLFKKLVIADRCGILVNDIFSNYTNYSGPAVFLGTVLFAFQIYGDFSGYSDIARGTSKLFGFDLMVNFRCPYFSRNIAEFWQRWHISLNTWFRDYVYIPLGGSRCSRARVLRNVLIVFLVSGLWHGANWTFVIWGLLNAVIFIPVLLASKNVKKLSAPSFRDAPQILFTFLLTCLCWVFFRAETVADAFGILASMFANPYSFKVPSAILGALSLIGVLLVIEWISREREVPGFANWYSSQAFYLFLICMVLVFGNNTSSEFIYFQF